MLASKTTAARFARAILGAVAIVSFASAPPAGASHVPEDEVPSTYSDLQRMKSVDVMHMIDSDKNGYVTREEFLEFQDALFERIDKDGDRRLAAVEFTDRG
jgi:hypothetical protein